MKFSILGTEYTVTKKKYDDFPYFAKNSVDGICDSVSHEIIYGDMTTFPGWEDETPEYAVQAEKGVLRHEIVHAFLNESGLQQCAHTFDGPWSKDEEIVDWIAIQGPKIYAAWVEAGAV